MSRYVLRARFAQPVCLVIVLLLLPAYSLAQSEGPASKLLRLESARDPSGTTISIHTNGVVSSLKQFRLENPNRLVVDFPGMNSSASIDRLAVGTPEVRQVRIGVFPGKLRLVLDGPGPDANFRGARIEREPSGIRIFVAASSRSPETLGSQDGVGSTHPDDLRAAALELSAAARELRAAVRELAASGVQPTAPRSSSPGPPAPSVAPSVQPAPEASSAAPERSARVAPTSPPPRSARVAPTSPPPSREAPAPRAALAELRPGEADFAATTAWIEANRAAVPSISPGEILGQNDLARLSQVVPPAYLAEFQFPSVEVEIQATGQYKAHPVYESATLQWGPQTELQADHSLTNYVAGLPFSQERIAAARGEDAAYMVAWNRVYRWQHYGYKTSPSHQVYLKPGPRSGRQGVLEDVLIGGGKVERHLVSDYHRVYFNHLATHAHEDFSLKVSDAKRLRYKDYLLYTDPFELRGSAFVIERSLDVHERDQVNSYLPTERRVRRLSPKERADSFLGSEFTLDDFEGFSGRVLDYEWAFRGEKTILAITDARGPQMVFHGPESRIPKDRWQVRHCYVIEQRPILKDHPYGRKLLFIDKETYGIPLGLYFDPEDQLLRIVKTSYTRPEGEGGANPEPGQTVGHWLSGFAINVQTGVSTAVWSGGTEVPDVTASQVRRLFSVANLTEGR